MTKGKQPKIDFFINITVSFIEYQGANYLELHSNNSMNLTEFRYKVTSCAFIITEQMCTENFGINKLQKRNNGLRESLQQLKINLR